MPFTAADVIARVKEHVSAFYNDTDPQALDVVNEAHANVVRGCGLYPSENLDVTLVYGAGEYALNPDVYRIESATYKESLNGYWPLVATSVDELDHETPSWRDLNPSRPYRYYESGGMIGFYPVPSTTSVMGLPFVRLRVVKANRLASIDSTLPSQIDKPDAWVWETCLRWAVRNDSSQIALFAPLARAATEDLKRLTQDRLIRQKPRAVAAFRPVRNR